ncbi:MAG: hypothetical protein ABR590_06285 [Spirochaetia bacterium]
MSHTLRAATRVSWCQFPMQFLLNFLAVVVLAGVFVGPVVGQHAVEKGSQAVLGHLVEWPGEAPSLTRRGALLINEPVSGDEIQPYDLIETPASSALLFVVYDTDTPLATPLRVDLGPASAVLVLDDGHIVLLEGRVRLRDMQRGRVLTYRNLEVVPAANADIDIIATIDDSVLVSARVGRAELGVSDPAVPVQRVFVSPGVGALFYPGAGVRNIQIEPGADTDVMRLYSELAEAAAPEAAASTSTNRFSEAVAEYEQDREQFLGAYEAVFRDHALIQDLRRIDRAGVDGVPLGFTEIFPDGSGRSLRDISEDPTATATPDIPATTATDGLVQAGDALFQAALDFDRSMRRVSRFVGSHSDGSVRDLESLLGNRAGPDRERLAAAYYAARLLMPTRVGP